MKLNKRKIVSYLLILCVSLSLTACNNYKYNYYGDGFKLQYDENLLETLVVNEDNETLVRVDDFNYGYVTAVTITKEISDPRIILDNFQKNHLKNMGDGAIVIDGEVISKTGRYKKSTTEIIEYNYTIKKDMVEQYIQTRVESIGEKQFITSFVFYKNAYDEKTKNALQLTYNSAKLDLE